MAVVSRFPNDCHLGPLAAHRATTDSTSDCFDSAPLTAEISARHQGVKTESSGDSIPADAVDAFGSFKNESKSANSQITIRPAALRINY